MSTNNSFSMSRIMTLVKQDKSFFILAAILIIIGHILIMPQYFTNFKLGYDIHELAFAFGNEALPLRMFGIIDAILIACASYKFTEKNDSKAYRLFPATAGEKCANIIIDYFLIMVIGYVIKIVFCFILCIGMGDIAASLDAIKSIFINRKEGYGMITAPAIDKWSFDAPGHLLSYSFWPMEKIGIPWPIERYEMANGDVMPSPPMMGGIIHDWTPYPLLAFGLNLVDFLINSLFTILLIAMFVIVKTNKKFRQTIEGKIVLCFLALFVLATLEFSLLDSHHIGYFFSIILTSLFAIGPWCWMSMYGWMIQAAILLVFNALAIYYLYYKIKTI